MKKFCLCIISFLLLCISCSENLENNTNQKSGNVIIKIEDSKSSARFFSPAKSFDISKVEEWNLTFTQITPVNGKTYKFTLKNSEDSVTLGVGTYNLYIEGSYTITDDNNGSTIVNLSGTETNVIVKEGKNTEIPILIGLKKTETGTGSFAVTFAFDDSSDNGSSWTTYYTDYGTTTDNVIDYSKGIKVVLVSKTDQTVKYSTDDTLEILTDNAENGKALVVSGENISSGYYYIEFYADYAESGSTETAYRKVNFNSDSLIEIADAQETLGDFVNLLFPDTAYTYYASDAGSSDANGLSKACSGNLYTILKNIYANKAVSAATINYTYSGKIEFDVSKVQKGKSVTISCQKSDSDSSYSFSIDESGLISMGQGLSLDLTTTDKNAKKLGVKQALKNTISLNNGTYLDFSSFSTSDSLTIELDVDDADYYMNNPMVVSSKELTADSFKFNKADFSEYSSGESSSAVFTYNVSKKENTESSLYEMYAEEPSVYVEYYGNSGSETAYKIGDDSKSFTENSSSLASWCDDGAGGFYVFKAVTTSNKFMDSPSYSVVHYKKIQKGASFILNAETINFSVTNVPVSMCTDGTNIYYVESVVVISSYGGKSPDFGSWGAWAHKDCKVKYFSKENPSNVQELDFSDIFTDGKVTAIYYYNNELYVAGYKKESIGSITDDNSNKTEFFDSTYSVYKLTSPTDVSTAILVSDVFKNSTENPNRIVAILDSNNSTTTQYTSGSERIKSYNAITDMTIMDSKLYVLENSFYYASATYYGAKGSLRQVSLENGNVLKTIERTDSDQSDTSSFKVPNKILAVLPKKLKLIIADSGKDNTSTGSSYCVDLSGTEPSVAEENNGSAYYFDKYSIASGFFNSDAFTENAYYTSKTSSEDFDE